LSLCAQHVFLQWQKKHTAYYQRLVSYVTMGATQSSLDPHHVVVLGVPGSGRKTLARALIKQLPFAAAEPCVAGMEVLTAASSTLRVTTWSVCGSDRIKPLWPTWAEGATCLVLAVDAAGGAARMEDARSELASLGKMGWTSCLPLVVIATKVDAPGALSASAVEVACDAALWGQVDGRRWTSLPFDATAGDDVDSLLKAITGSS
jgi:signal recognition particle receptor subunit beta